METELLVEEIAEFINLNYRDQEIWMGDICAGSGAIGVATLKMFPKLKVFACDISRKALKVAKTNYKNFNSDRFKIAQGDFFKPLQKTDIKLNVLAINPPYISGTDDHVSPNTFKYEPNLALFAENDGMYFYNKFFDEGEKYIDFLKPFLAVLEFGFQQKELIEELANKHLQKFSGTIKKDYFQNGRYLVIK